MSRHYMIKMTKAGGAFHKEERVAFPAYIETDTEKCLERFHRYAIQIEFTNKIEREAYTGGCVYRNPADETEVLRFR